MDRTNDHDDAQNLAAPVVRVSFIRTLAAPWLILSPSRAARSMTGGSRWAFWLSFGLGTFLLAALIVWLGMLDAAFSRVWVDGDLEVRERSMSEVWRGWHAVGWIGPAELLTAGVCLGLPFLAAVAAWLYLPNLHRSGSAWQSYKRSFGAVASGVGLLIIWVAVVFIPIAMASIASDRGTSSVFEDEKEYFMAFAIASSLGGACLLLYWLGRATLAVAGPVVAAALPPRCEGCGYNLTHRPEDDRCTECGMSITASLTPGLRRSGCDWQARQGIAGWLSTTVKVIISPTRFYQGVMLRRGDGESRRFAVWHYPAIGGLATVWCFCLVVFTAGPDPPPGLVVIVPAVIGLVAALAGWCVHRLVGAMMSSWVIVRGALPDVSWAAKVMAYETAFLWVFCAYNGLLLSSFMVYDDWISDHLFTIMFGNQFGFPAEPFAVLFGNTAMIAAWMWRYGIAFRCIRWSNF